MPRVSANQPAEVNKRDINRTGILDPVGDRDPFRFRVTRAGRVTFRLSGENVGVADELGDPFLRVYNSSGALIGSDDDSGIGLNSFLRLNLPRGAYLAEAGSFNDAGTGGYRLTISGRGVA
jgi:serralysin